MIFRSRMKGAAEVQIAGDFNDWMPHTTPMRRISEGDFEARLKLPRGALSLPAGGRRTLVARREQSGGGNQRVRRVELGGRSDDVVFRRG